MSKSDDFNGNAGRFSNDVSDDDYLLAGMVATRVFERTLSDEGRKLHESIARSGMFDRKTISSTYNVPTGAKPEALKEALQLLDASSDPSVPIFLVDEATGKTEEMERDPHLFTKLNSSALRRTLREMEFGTQALLPAGTKKLLYPPKASGGSAKAAL